MCVKTQVRVEPPDSTITLTHHGRFGFGIDQWAYVPFDVPAGVRRIDVSTTHSRFSLGAVANNVLDLGIFGPAGYEVGNAAGFRGWSGGARSEFSLSATHATPGYLPGPIDAGRWTLAFGPVVLNPLGMAWQADIVLTRGVAAAQLPRAAALAHACGGAGWYRGDLHLHTVHSDGRYGPGELAAVAREVGLDFIVSTDHNTNSANRAWPECDTEGLVVVGGEEVTTRHGHWLAVGLSPKDWLDWRYAPSDGVFERYAAAVRAAGGFVVAAHPAVPLPGSAWEFGFGDVDAIEVWNGAWNLDDEASLRIWHRLLRRGRRVIAVGGSDSHGPHQPVGRPQTVVHAEGSSAPELVAGLRRGRCYLAESSAVQLTLTASSEVGGRLLCAGPGDTLPIAGADDLTVTATVRGAPDSRIAIITATGRAAAACTDGSGVGSVRWTGSGDRMRFARAEVRSRAFPRSMVALTNPVWLPAIAQCR